MAKVYTIETSASFTDEALLNEFKSTGNQEALARLYLHFSDLVYGTCLKYLQEPEDAKDAVMNIYQELLKKLPNHEVENFKGWLYVLTKNHCLMQLRAAKKNITVSFENHGMQSDEFSHLESVMEKEDEFKRLEKCMETLTKEQKQSIEMFYYQNKCYNEIVETTGMDWNKVRSTIQNGRRNLKNCIEKNVNE